MSDKTRYLRILFGCLVILSFLITSCASKKPVWGDPQTGLILQYRLAQDQILKYNISTDQSSVMNMMGQSMETLTDVNVDFTMECTEVDDQNNILTQVTLEAIDITMDGMQGKSNINTTDLIGKSFGISLSSIGEKEFIGIEDVPEINFGEMSGGNRSVQAFFTEIIPQLSPDPVKVGESWTVQKEYTEPMGDLELLIKFESTSTLDGLETIEGVECARVQSQLEGTVSGAGSTGGMYMVFTGELTSTSTWYFDFKEGLYVRESAEQIMDAEIDLGDMGVLPMVMTDKYEMRLVL
jgi:hypothetical protein